jgi:PAS domain S-box-containing protein
MQNTISPTGVERFFGDGTLIVTKTDLKGIITYANRDFLNICGYAEAELMGRPHNVIRHPDMPRCIFHMLWETIRNAREIFAYVVNHAKNGDHYWVFAHVTPSFNDRKEVVGYHSSRRVPKRSTLEASIIPLYRQLREAEQNAPDPKSGLQASNQLLSRVLQDKGTSYDRFIFSL